MAARFRHDSDRWTPTNGTIRATMKRTAKGTAGLLSCVEKSFIQATRGEITQATSNMINASDAMTKRGVGDRNDAAFMARRYQRDQNNLTQICPSAHWTMPANFGQSPLPMAYPEMRIVGVHPVDDAADCYLIESIISHAKTQPDFGQITQPEDGVDASNWQVPFDEKLLDDEGKSVIADLFLTTTADWPSEARVAFFFHNLDVAQPLTTPFGDVRLPSPSSRPTRLEVLVYEAP